MDYRKLEDRYYPLIQSVLEKHFNTTNIILTKSTPEEDMTQGFDASTTIKDKLYKIGIRIRQYPCDYRDFTIRTTEYPKIYSGKCDLYFYGWQLPNEKIDEYILVDMNKFRNYITFNPPTTKKTNVDKKETQFYYFNLNDMKNADTGNPILKHETYQPNKQKEIKKQNKTIKELQNWFFDE